MFKLRSIASRLIVLTVAAACGVLGTFSVLQQRSLKQLALEQQLKLQYASVIAAVDYEGRAAVAVSAVVANLPPVADAIGKGDRVSSKSMRPNSSIASTRFWRTCATRLEGRPARPERPGAAAKRLPPATAEA